MTSATATMPASAALDWTPGQFALQDTWFPIVLLPQIRTSPIRRFIHGKEYRIWRDGGAVHVVASAAEGERSAERVRHASRYNYLWVWYGAADRADEALLPDVAFLPPDRPLAASAYGTNFFHCTYELVLENILDLTHIDYVHQAFSGTSESIEDGVTCSSTSETVTMVREVTGRPTSNFQRDVLGVKIDRLDMRVVTHVLIRSGISFHYAKYSHAPSSPLMQTNTPETPWLTRANFARGMGEIDCPIYRREWPKTGPLIAAQDDAMFVPQSPRYLKPERRRDLHTRFDAAGVQYRARHNALVERQAAGDFAYLPDAGAGRDIGTILDVKRVTARPARTLAVAAE